MFLFLDTDKEIEYKKDRDDAQYIFQRISLRQTNISNGREGKDFFL